MTRNQWCRRREYGTVRRGGPNRSGRKSASKPRSLKSIHTPQTVRKEFEVAGMKEPLVREVELFTWEKLDAVEEIRKEFAQNFGK